MRSPLYANHLSSTLLRVYINKRQNAWSWQELELNGGTFVQQVGSLGYVCVWVCAHVYAMAYMWYPEGNSLKLILYFHQVMSKGQTQVNLLGSKCLYPPSHVTCPNTCFQWSDPEACCTVSPELVRNLPLLPLFTWRQQQHDSTPVSFGSVIL